MRAETARTLPENVISGRLITLEETLKACRNIGLSHEFPISVAEICHVLVTKQLPPEMPKRRKRLPLREIIASEVADYEGETGKRVAASLLGKYGWKRAEIDAKVREYHSKPNLRIVPKRKKPKKARKKPAKKKKASISPRAEPHPQDIFRQYLREIGRHNLLSHDEAYALALRIRQGDMEAQGEMTVRNLRLVVSISRQYEGRGVAKEDLISMGNGGLLKAVTRYDPFEGTRFSTYATWWIKQQMRRGIINEAKNVRTPAYMVEIIGKLNRLQREHLALAGDKLSVDELCEATGFSRANVERALKASNSISEQLYEGETSPLVDDADDPVANKSAEYSENIENAYRGIDELSERERFIVNHRYGKGCEPETLEEIGRKVRLTRERVRQIEAIAVKKLQVSCGVITKEEYFLWRESTTTKKKK